MTYRAYGVVIDSDFSLAPCLSRPNSGRKADIVVRRRRIVRSSTAKLIHVQNYESRLNYARFYKTRSGFLVQLRDFGDFSISRHGGRIGCAFKVGLSGEQRVVGLMQHALPLALSLRGDLILHCASVVIDKKARLIVGDAGIGKSTLAHFLYRQGLQVYSDDAARIKRVSGKFLIRPSVPIMRIRDGREKSITIIADQGERAAKVEGIYFPRFARGRKKFFAEKVDAAEGLRRLLPQLFRLDMDSGALMVRELELLAGLCRHAPLYAVNYAHDKNSLARFKNLLVTHSRRPIR